MDYFKQLDDILGFLDDGDRPSTSFLSIKRKFIDISGKDLYLILDKLHNDGYIIYEKDSKSRYSITYDGLMFLSYGGYAGQYKRDTRKNRRDFIVDLALIFGGIGAAIAGLYALWNMLNDIYNPVCYYCH